MFQRMDLLGVRIAAVNLNNAYGIICQAVVDHQKSYVCVAPVATLVDCQRVPGYKDVVNAALMTTPDGMPIVWLGKLKGFHINRTYGPDLMRLTLDQGRSKGLKHFFYGSTPATCQALITKAQTEFPGVKIVGSYAPPFKDDLAEEDEVLERINASGADIIWVSLGSPKQDFWMHRYRMRLHAPLLIGIGAAFDFISGVKPQAPVWIQRSGFEWMFRLCCEPRRLWRRYLIGNTLFIAYILRDVFKKPSV